MSAPVHFVLTELESSVTMDLSGSLQTSTIPTLDVSAVAILYVSVDDIKNVFKYQTDSNDVTNADSTDLKYYVDPASWPDLNPANAMLDDFDAGSTGAIATMTGDNNHLDANKMLVAHDFVRYLALMLFKTHFGVDLFNNEIALLNSLRGICDDSAQTHTWFDIKSKLELVGINGTHADLEEDGDGNKYMDNKNSGPENLCRVLMEQMTGSAITRFAEIDATHLPQPLPFAVDDSISFKLIIAPADGQEELTGGTTPFETRSYEIRLILVDSPVNTAVADDETA